MKGPSTLPKDRPLSSRLSLSGIVYRVNEIRVFNPNKGIALIYQFWIHTELISSLGIVFSITRMIPSLHVIM